MKIKLIKTIAPYIFGLALFITPISALASPVQGIPQQNAGGNAQHHTHGLNRNEGHFGPIAANDHHTPMWNRFDAPNYNFTSGPNYRYTLGRPTYAHGFVRPQSTQNMRFDAQGSFAPPNNRFMSGVYPVEQVNPFIPLPVNNTPWQTNTPHGMTPWDSTGQGANAHHQHGTTITQSQGGMLPSTSILN